MANQILHRKLKIKKHELPLKPGINYGGFFLKKNILIPNVAENKIFLFWWREKKSDSEFLSYNLMFNSGKKN